MNLLGKSAEELREFLQSIAISRAMSSAVRRAVPLKTMCSMKCEMPLSSAGSRRDPERTQMPTDTEWT